MWKQPLPVPLHNSVDPRRSMELLGPAVAALSGSIRQLSPEAWGATSSCAGWTVADLVSHVVVNGHMVLTFGRRALVNDPTPAFGPAARELREQIKAAGPGPAAERQDTEAQELTEFAAGLSDEDFARIGQHPLGPRSVAWICTSRLAEVVFHHWDLRRSFGEAGSIDPDVAEHLLPYLLNPEYLRLLTMRKSAEAPPETFRLTSTPGGATWRVIFAPSGAQVEQGEGPANIHVSADPQWLALAMYGRGGVASPHFSVSGPPDAAERFATYFGA